MECDPLHEQPEKLLALDTSFGLVRLDLLGTLPERVQPGDGLISRLYTFAPIA